MHNAKPPPIFHTSRTALKFGYEGKRLDDFAA